MDTYKSKNKLTTQQINRIISFSTIILIIGSVFGISSSVFLQNTTDGSTELSLLMYNGVTDKYEARNYPEEIYSDSNISIFFVVKNFEDIVRYYQLQIKIVELTQNVSSLQPISTLYSSNLYPNNTFEKILSPALNAEKKESGTFTGEYIWGPSEIILYVNSEVVSHIVSPNFLKIVFELWEYNTETSGFDYTGVFAFLELDYWVF